MRHTSGLKIRAETLNVGSIGPSVSKICVVVDEETRLVCGERVLGPRAAYMPNMTSTGIQRCVNINIVTHTASTAFKGKETFDFISFSVYISDSAYLFSTDKG